MILSKILKGFGTGLVGSLYQMIAAYAVVVIVTHFLTPAEYGVFHLARSIGSVLFVFVLIGLPRALDRYIPVFESQQERGKTKALVYQVFAIILALAFVASLLLLLGSGAIARYYKVSDLGWVLRFLTIWLCGSACTEAVGAVFRGFREVRYQVYLEQVIAPSLHLALGLGVLALGFGLPGWIVVFVFSSVVAATLGLYFLWKHLYVPYSRFALQRIDLGQVLRYSWPLSVSTIFVRFFGQVSTLLMGSYATPDAIGVYNLYVIFAGLLTLVLQSFARIYKPVASALVAGNNLDELKRTYVRVSRWIISLNGFILIMILVLGSSITELVFEEAYSAFPLALSILAVGNYVKSAVGTEGMTLEAFGHTRLSLLNSILMLITNVVLGLWLIPSQGVVGAAIATGSAWSVGALAGLCEIYVLYRLHPFEHMYLRTTLVCLSTASILFWLRQRYLAFGKDNLAIVLGFLIVGAGIYLGGLSLFRAFDRVDWELFKRTLARVRCLAPRRNAKA